MSSQFDLRRGWYVVIVLCALYIFSYIDRSIIGVMATGISKSLGLTDTQLGLVIGAGFAFVYAGVGIPIAHWMDNGDRRLGLIIGVLVWSAATAASGLTTGFWSLLVCRAGVAVGEAVLTPAAVSMIADMFGPSRRTAPMTLYAAVGAVMAMGGLVGGAAALRIGEALSVHVALEPWRVALILLGVAGALLATLILFTVKEPSRIAAGANEKAGDGSVREIVRYIVGHRRFFLPFYIGAGISTLFPMALMIWSPTLLVRQHGYDQAGAGYAVGTFGVIFSVVGTLTWPMLSRAAEARMPGRGAVIALACASAVAMLAVVAPVSLDSRIVVAGVGLSMACLAAWSVLPPLIVQRFVPSRMRARMIALHLFFISTVGYGFGSLAAVKLAGLWRGEANLGNGLFALGAIACPLSLFCYLACVRAASILSPEASAGQGER